MRRLCFSELLLVLALRVCVCSCMVMQEGVPLSIEEELNASSDAPRVHTAALVQDSDLLQQPNLQLQELERPGVSNAPVSPAVSVVPPIAGAIFKVRVDLGGQGLEVRTVLRRVGNDCQRFYLKKGKTNDVDRFTCSCCACCHKAKAKLARTMRLRM